MNTIKVKIEGLTPLLINKFGDAAEASAGLGERSSIVGRGDRTPREEAETKLYVNEKGGVFVPGMNLLACLIEGGKFHKIGKSKVTTLKSTLVTAGIFLKEIELPLKPAKWEVDTRAVRIPATGGRIPRHRPRFDKWGCRSRSTWTRRCSRSGWCGR
jgi:hypothetical protein